MVICLIGLINTEHYAIYSKNCFYTAMHIIKISVENNSFEILENEGNNYL